MSDGENDKEREAAPQLSAREESEVIDILHQILEDIDPCQLSAYTILERLRDEYESEYVAILCVNRSITPYKDAILNEIDAYVAAKQKENANDEKTNETSDNSSLNRIYIVSSELQAITKQSECSGKEVRFLFTVNE